MGSNDKVKVTIVIKITPGMTKCIAIVKANYFIFLFFKTTFAIIDVKKLEILIIGNIEVKITIVVDIGKTATMGVGFVRNYRSSGYLFKLSVSFIAV